jgi:uncharacterized protein YggE
VVVKDLAQHTCSFVHPSRRYLDMHETLRQAMSGRFGWLAAGALTGVLTVVLAGPALAPVRAGADDNQPTEHTVSVTGVGTVKAKPDVADATVGVRVQRDRARDAEVDAAAAMTKVVEALKAQGIAEDDIQTVTLSLSPVYNYNRDPAVLVGYEAVNIVSITIRDLAKAGQTIDAAVDAGATEIGDISFRLEDQAAVEAQAREAAMVDAKSKADALAKAGGVSITGVITITEQSAPMPTAIPYAAEAADASGREARPTTPVLGGDVELIVTVAVVYSIG